MTKLPVLLLCGESKSGKNATADMLTEHVTSTRGARAEQIALADPMKRLMRDLFGFRAENLWGPGQKRDEVVKITPLNMTNACDLVANFFAADLFPLKPFDRDDAMDAFEAWYDQYRTRTTLTAREPLQTFGTELVRDHLGDRVWADTAVHVARELLADGGGYHPEVGMLYSDVDRPNYVWVTDGRFPSEVYAFEEVGAAPVRVLRPNLPPTRGHSSETALAAVPREKFAGVILNDAGLDELRARACGLFDALFPKG